VLSITGCTDGKQGMVQSRLPHDTLYTEQKAIAVYGYDPVRALQIVDSAVIFGPSLREGVCYTSEELSRKQIVPRITEVLTGN